MLPVYFIPLLYFETRFECDPNIMFFNSSKHHRNFGIVHAKVDTMLQDNSIETLIEVPLFHIEEDSQKPKLRTTRI